MELLIYCLAAFGLFSLVVTILLAGVIFYYGTMLSRSEQYQERYYDECDD